MKSDPELDPDPLVRGTDPGSRRTKMSQIPNTGSLCPGIAVSGSGAGALVVPPLAAQLALRFGWRGCNRLVVQSLFFQILCPFRTCVLVLRSRDYYSLTFAA